MSPSTGDGALDEEALLDQEHVHAQFASDVAFTTDAVGHIVWASAASARILGWTPEELRGRRVRDLIHPEDAAKAEVWRQQLLGTEGSGEGGTADPLRLVRSDGSTLWCRVSASPVRDRDGRLLGLAGTIHDVADLVEARASLARAHDLLRRVVDGQVDPHVLLLAVRDEAGTIVDFVYEDANSAAAAFEGRSRDRLEGSTMLEVYRDREEALTDIAECASVLLSGQQRTASDVVTRDYRDADGRPLVVDISIVPIDQDRVSYSWRDVTRRHIAQERLQEARREIEAAHSALRQTIDAHVDPHVLLAAVRDAQGEIHDFRYEDVNEAAARFEDLARLDMIGSTIRLVYRDDAEAAADIADCILALETDGPVERNDSRTYGYSDREGRDPIVDIRIVPLGPDRVLYTWRDVTDRHLDQQRLAESEERFRLLAENMSDVVALVQDGVVVWISPSVTRVTGHPALWVIGRDPLSLLHPDDVEAAQQAWVDLPSGSMPRQRFRARSADGTYHWVDAEASIVPGSEGRSVVLALRTVDAEVAALSALQIQARHDELTGLVNRHEVFEHISRSLSGETRSGTRLAMVFCDLDGFKAVNDDHGHAVGDELLRQLAARLQATVRSGDIVARIGGDEFLIVLNGVQDLDNAIALADKLRQQVAMPVAIPGGVISVGASVGVTLAERGESVDAIVARADDAMYLAKRRGKDAVVAIPGPEVTPGR